MNTYAQIANSGPVQTELKKRLKVNKLPIGIVVNQAKYDNRYDYYHRLSPKIRQ